MWRRVGQHLGWEGAWGWILDGKVGRASSGMGRCMGMDLGWESGWGRM